MQSPGKETGLFFISLICEASDRSLGVVSRAKKAVSRRTR